MPSLSKLGDSDAVENKYIDRFILYVEGEDDRKILSIYLLQGYAQDIEIKVPSKLGGGGNSVIDRVQDERSANRKIFGIVDGDVLLAKGHFAHYREAFGTSDWIQDSEHEGIYFLPGWEIENILYSKRILPQTILDLQPVKKLQKWTLRVVENGVMREAFRLSELAALNLALLEECYPTIRAQTMTETVNRRKLHREIENYISNLENAESIMARFAEWRCFFRSLLPDNCNRDVIYEQFVSRVDGKALGIMLQKRFSLHRDIRPVLARNFCSDKQAMRLIDKLIKSLRDTLD